VQLQHPSEAVYCTTAGAAEILDEGNDERFELITGSMVHIDAGCRYRFVAITEAELVGGACPPDPALYSEFTPSSPDRRSEQGSGGIRIFHRDRPSHLLPLISSDARLVIWPGVGARFANLNYVTMQSGEANTPHTHPTSEDTIYIVEGKGSVQDLTNERRLMFGVGDVVHVPAGVRHAVHADRGERVVSLGGPCPPDHTLLRHAVPAS
jgi:quercetin dioxygenase-like cupin family protein